MKTSSCLFSLSPTFNCFPWLPTTLRIRTQIFKVLYDLLTTHPHLPFSHAVCLPFGSLAACAPTWHRTFAYVVFSTGNALPLLTLSPFLQSSTQKATFLGKLSLTTPCSPTVIGAFLLLSWSLLQSTCQVL